ncbi:MAG: choice-of-anchor J domain-containing protein [Bacteroidetes bacterium]|nr:choice-of-anchor J domain-containing protein [Bacteroidota bacterium]
MRINFTQRKLKFFFQGGSLAMGLLLTGACLAQTNVSRDHQQSRDDIRKMYEQKMKLEQESKAKLLTADGTTVQRAGWGSNTDAFTELTYCTPPATNCNSSDVINRVRLGTLDNASGCSAGPPAGYADYTAAVAAPVVYSGALSAITVNVPTLFTEQLAVWIDYNQNGQFEVNEYTNLGSNTGTGGIVNGNISIPATALSGVTRMRVRVRFSTALGSGDACSGYTFGETEDYNINIQPCVGVSITGNPTNAAIACGGNASFTLTTTGSLPSFQWQYKAVGSTAWQNVPATLPFSGQNTATLTITNASQTFSGYQFRAMVSGACSAFDPSAAATLTVNQLVPVVNPAAPAICTGAAQQLTLTNTIGNTELINEGFNTVVPLPAGWASQNNSTPVGGTSWFQGNPLAFPAQSGNPNSYIGVNFNSVTGANTISNWLITPTVAIKNGDIFRFWTRKVTPSNFADRLEVRLNTTNTTNVGATNTSVGDFTNLLLTINPTLTVTGYPSVWTEYLVVVSGLAAPVPAGRFAFRYFVTNGGPLGANSDYIGIDNVGFTSVGGPALGTWTGPAGTMWTDAATTVPYTAGTLANSIWVNPNATTDYSVSYNTLTPCASATKIVTVSVIKPAVLATSPANSAVCKGGSTTFTATATGGPLTYQWQRSTDGGLTYTNIAGATASTLTVSDITMAMSGYRYRCVISAAPCAGSVISTDAILTVNAPPVVTLSSPDLLLIPGQPTSITASSIPAAAAGGWVWNYNGSTIAGNNTNTVTGINIDRSGTYRATVTDVNGCTATSNDIVVGSEASDRLWIYPNPTTGVFQVRLYYNPVSVYEKRAVYIYNAQGQLMTSQEFDLVNTTAPYMKMEFDLGKAAAGTYVVKVVHKYSGKIVSGLVVVH